LIALTLLGCGHSDSETLRRTFSRSDSGILVRYPTGWSSTARNDTAVINPALCFTLRRRALRGRPTVEVKLVEYLPPELDRGDLRGRRPVFEPRPRRFRYDRLARADVRWTTGRASSFQEHGRAFFVGVAVHGRLDHRTQRTRERIVDSIRVSAGRCRPAGAARGRQ
jgi:hypothetical protein